MGNYTFKGCTNLSEVIFEKRNDEQKLKIGSSVFEGCNSLDHIDYYGTEDDWNEIDKSKSSLPNPLSIEKNANYIRIKYKADKVCECFDGSILMNDNTVITTDNTKIEKVIEVIPQNSSTDVEINLRGLNPQESENFDGINFGCQCKFDLSLKDGKEISESNPAVIRFKKDFIGYKLDSIAIVHFNSITKKNDIYRASKKDEKYRVYDDGDYWKITVYSLSPFATGDKDQVLPADTEFFNCSFTPVPLVITPCKISVIIRVAFSS